MLSFNMLDFLIIGVVCLSVLFGLLRGFVASLLSLVGWVLTIFLSYKGYPLIESSLTSKFSNPAVAQSLGYGGLFLFFLIAIGIINMMILRSIASYGFGFLDSIAGAFFGFFRGALVVVFFYFCFSISYALFNGTGDKDEHQVAPKMLTEAKTYGMLKLGKAFFMGFLSDDFNQRVNALYDEWSNKPKNYKYMPQLITKLQLALPEYKAKENKPSLANNDNQNNTELGKLQQLYQLYKTHEDKLPEDKKLSEQEIKNIESLLHNHLLNSDSSGEGEE